MIITHDFIFYCLVSLILISTLVFSLDLFMFEIQLCNFCVQKILGVIF